MTHKPPVTEYRDAQAALRKAMKAYEDYDVDLNDSESLAEAHRLWNEAMAANDTLLGAAAKRPIG